MSTHITDESLFHSWEATPEPPVGQPDGDLIFEQAGDVAWLWRTSDYNEMIKWDGPLMDIKE